jgi:hypothetical protein
MPKDKSLIYSQTNEKKESEPLMVNRHSEAEPWEYDPNWIDPIYIIQEGQDVKEGEEDESES